MGILEEQVDRVIRVDTHRDSRFAKLHANGRQVWAIESSGSFDSGLTKFLLAHGEYVAAVGSQEP
jgi:hypothetical protein